MTETARPMTTPVAAPRPLPRVPTSWEIVALVCAVAPFLLRFSTTSQGTTREWSALIGGGLAVVGGLVSLALVARTDRTQRMRRLAIAVGCLGLGAFFVARGFGLV